MLSVRFKVKATQRLLLKTLILLRLLTVRVCRAGTAALPRSMARTVPVLLSPLRSQWRRKLRLRKRYNLRYSLRHSLKLKMRPILNPPRALMRAPSASLVKKTSAWRTTASGIMQTATATTPITLTMNQSPPATEPKKQYLLNYRVPTNSPNRISQWAS